MSSTRQAAYKSIITIILVSLLASLLPVSVAMGQVACRLTVYANGPYEVWAGYEECPSIVVDDGIILPGYYAAPSFGYVFLGGASSTNSFDDNYQYYVIATRSLFKLEAIQRPNGNFISKADSWKAWGNVHRPLEFDEDGKLIGDFRDYSHQDYIYGPPDGLTEDVGLPPQYCCVPGGVPFQGFVAVRTTVPVLLVHGIYSSSKMWDTSMFGDEFIVETIDLTPNNGDISYLATQLKDKIQSMKEKYGVKKVDIVAHSMGGLVSRWYIQNLRGRDVNKLIMIGTPNHGSEWGNLKMVGDAIKGDIKFMGPAASQMLPHSPFLRSLNLNDKCAAIFGPDNDKIDYVGGTAEYFVLASLEIPTPSHEHIYSWKIPVIHPGDGVVPYDSAKLDNVYTDLIFPCHICKQGKNKAVIKKVKDILRGGSSTKNKNLASSQYYSPSSKLEEEQEASDALSSIEVVNDVIYPTEVKRYNISLDNAVTAAYFSIGWEDGILDLTLHSPNGTVINSSFANMSQNITYFEIELYKYYHIKALEIGNWSIEISAVNVSDTGTKFTFTAFLESYLFVGVNTSKNIFGPGEEINISAYVGSNESAFTGALVVAKISKPDNTTENITLYDDGLHNDNQTNDGIYASTCTNTSSWGTYHITISATGTLDGEEFERETSTTVWVEQYPDLTLTSSDIYFSNDAPLAGENITISATIHNMGDTNANNASVLFYDGEPANGELIGEDIINVGAGQTAKASIFWNAIVGQHEIYVLISPFNEFLEENYTNNQANKTIHVCMITQPNIPLVNGWNLISVPHNLTSWVLGEEAVVGNPLNVTPKNSLTSIYRYNTTSGLFEKCDHFDDWGWWQATGSESFTKLEPGRGYWVMAKNDCNLTFTGSAPSDLNINLDAGWNLIGWYSMEEALLGEEAVVGNQLNVTPKNSLTSIYRYNSSTGLFEKCDHFDDWGWWQATGSESFTKLEPGSGYWVMAKNDCEWMHEA